MRKHFSSLAVRLTLWYAGVFSISFIAVFGSFFFMMSINFDHWTREELREEIVEINIAYGERGLPAVIQHLREEYEAEDGLFMGRIIDKDDNVIFDAKSDYWSHIKINPELTSKARNGEAPIEIINTGGGQSVHVAYGLLRDGSVVQVGLPLLKHELWMEQFSHHLLRIALLAFVLCVCAGGFMARRALSPIGEMARLASRIGGKSLGQRMPVSGRGDEVDRLAQSFNGMLERIDALVRGMHDVTDALAHDLKTPLTGIKSLAEVTLQERRDGEAYRMSLYRIVEHIDRLCGIFHSILDVSEAEGGAFRLRREQVRVDDLARDILQTFVPVAEDKGVLIEASIAPETIVQGDRSRLFQALANLLDNAVKYTPTGGKIRLLTEANPLEEGVIVTVADTGAGISPRDLPNIFERYYRGDVSRSGPGIGLGLPLVQGIVNAHGGRITVESEPGLGTVFRVFLGRGTTA